MDVEFCIKALVEVLAQYGRPDIFNSDQGSHLAALHRRFAGGWRANLDGRPGALDGQRLYRTALA